MARPLGSSHQLQCDTGGGQGSFYIPFSDPADGLGVVSLPSTLCDLLLYSLLRCLGLAVAGRRTRERAEEEPGGGELTDLPLSLKWQHICYFLISMISLVAPSPFHTSMCDIPQFLLYSARICLLIWP